jgi:hypothetical protein
MLTLSGNTGAGLVPDASITLTKLSPTALQLGAFGNALLHIEDQKASGTGGGTFTSGARRTRDLNTVVTNEISGASLASNQITLPAGTYYIQASAPSYNVNQSRLSLWNVTDSSYVIIGSNQYCAALTVSHQCIISGRFTIASTKVFEIGHECASSQAGAGFGAACTFGVREVYTTVDIWKIA